MTRDKAGRVRGWGSFRPVFTISRSLRRKMSKSRDVKPPDPPRYFLVLKDTFTAFARHNVYCLAAAMSFYAILSMAPILVLLLSLAGTVLDRETVARDVVTEVELFAGKEGAEVARTIIDNAHKPSLGKTTLIIGIAILIFGAMGVFGQLQDALNLIWEVESPPGLGLVTYVRKRLTSLILVLCVGVLLLISPVLTAVVTLMNAHLVGRVPQIAEIWQYLHLLASVVIMGLVFAAIFKLLPYVRIKWRDVWAGAAATAVLFALGQYLIGLYLGYSGLGSAFGAAGSLVVLLLWLYYSCLIMFFGAEFTHVFAIHYGSHARASRRSPRKPHTASSVQ